MRYKGIKGKVWKVLSEYIRERDGHECVTCGRSREEGYRMNAGHYLPMGLIGSNNKLSWDEMNIHTQCTVCNGQGQGEQALMAGYIERTYGKEVLDGLNARRYKVDPVKDWNALLDYYKSKCQNLK